MEAAVRTWPYPEWDLAVSGMQGCIWKSTAYTGHNTPNEEGERTDRGWSPRTYQQMKEALEELPEVAGNLERLNSSSRRRKSCAKCADRLSLMRTKDDPGLSITDITKENSWKMPALGRTLDIESGHLGKLQREESEKNC